MYSRRFANGTPDLPPDYGGVAYRKGQTDDENGTETDIAKFEEESKERTQSRPFSARGPRRENRSKPQTERRYPRRPLYDEPSVIPRQKNEGKEAREEREKSGGLLSSLFSLSGRSFSMEDIVLAGLILLMMTDRKDGREPDSELLLILGMLLLTK